MFYRNYLLYLKIISYIIYIFLEKIKKTAQSSKFNTNTPNYNKNKKSSATASYKLSFNQKTQVSTLKTASQIQYANKNNKVLNIEQHSTTTFKNSAEITYGSDNDEDLLKFVNNLNKIN